MEEQETNHVGQAFVPYFDVASCVGRAWRITSVTRFATSPVVPTPATMTAILDAIDASLAGNEPTHAHCWGGVGRTGTVIGRWLLRTG